MTKTTSITLPDEIFDLVDVLRGRIPRSTFISDILTENFVNVETENIIGYESERVFIDFTPEMTIEFEELIEFYRNFSMKGVTQSEFFKKIFEIGTINMKCTMKAYKKLHGEENE